MTLLLPGPYQLWLTWNRCRMLYGGSLAYVRRYFCFGLLRIRKMARATPGSLSWAVAFITRGVLAHIVNTDELQT